MAAFIMGIGMGFRMFHILEFSYVYIILFVLDLCLKVYFLILFCNSKSSHEENAAGDKKSNDNNENLTTDDRSAANG